MASPMHQLINGNIFVELGLTSLSDGEKADMLEQINDVVLKRVMLRVIELISDEQAQALGMLPTDEDKLNYILKAVPNFGELVEDEIQKMKHEIAAASLVS
ncbi:MAG: hypothetical protein KIH62_003935 [Candidatus Kerfeldbacteria bacterium]|nr:hypothetical protein [Candidatus Kerfeldbacteria bacterium]